MKKYFKNFTARHFIALALGVTVVAASFKNGNFMLAIFVGAPLLSAGIPNRVK